MKIRDLEMGVQFSSLVSFDNLVYSHTSIGSWALKTFVGVSLFKIFIFANPSVHKTMDSKIFLFTLSPFMAGYSALLSMMHDKDFKPTSLHFFTFFATALATDILFDRLLPIKAI